MHDTICLMFENVVSWISHVSSLHSSVLVNREFPPYDGSQKEGVQNRWEYAQLHNDAFSREARKNVTC